MSYVGKSTLGDITKKAKEEATKKGLIKVDERMEPQSPGAGNQVATQKQVQNSGSGSGNFFSNIGSDFNGLASSTSTMFSGMFGKSKTFKSK